MARYVIFLFSVVCSMLPPALPPRTRLSISLAVCLVGAAGLVVSDCLEKKYPQAEKK